MKVKVTTEVEAPDGATHYTGSLLNYPTWMKCTQIGVVGYHWWHFDKKLGWRFYSHRTPICKAILAGENSSQPPCFYDNE